MAGGKRGGVEERDKVLDGRKVRWRSSKETSLASLPLYNFSFAAAAHCFENAPEQRRAFWHRDGRDASYYGRLAEKKMRSLFGRSLLKKRGQRSPNRQLELGSALALLRAG